MSQKLYVYKLTVENGGAPCVKNNLLTLAICKPGIRRVAKENDIIFGFGSNKKPLSNRLIYIAVVKNDGLDGREYYKKRGPYIKRPDCIYEYENGRFKLRDGAEFHNDGKHIRNDLGMHPAYKNARVLFSNNFRYFGREATVSYKRSYEQIYKLVKDLGPNHRVNYGRKLCKELLDLKAETWGRFRKKVICKSPNQSGKFNHRECGPHVVCRWRST